MVNQVNHQSREQSREQLRELQPGHQTELYPFIGAGFGLTKGCSPARFTTRLQCLTPACPVFLRLIRHRRQAPWPPSRHGSPSSGRCILHFSPKLSPFPLVLICPTHAAVSLARLNSLKHMFAEAGEHR